MRAYLRLDPHLADKKADYPDGAHRAFVDTLCFAEQQPQRGYFRNEKLLRVLLEKRARWIAFLIEKGDLVVESDGRLYVDGWREWQEGDHTVPERMARLRARKGQNDTGGDTAPVTVGSVSGPSSGSGSGKRLAVSQSGGGAPLPNGGAPTFLGWRPKPTDHFGQHPGCTVCAPLQPQPQPKPKEGAA